MRVKHDLLAFFISSVRWWKNPLACSAQAEACKASRSSISSGLIVLFGLLPFATAALGANTEDKQISKPVLRGFLIEGPQLFASFADESGKADTTKWVAQGDQFLGFKFLGLNAARDSAIVQKGGQTSEIPLQDSQKAIGEAVTTTVPQDPKLNVAAVEKLFVEMQLDHLVERSMSKQKEVLGAQLDQLKQAVGQKKEVSDAIDKALSWEAIKGDLVLVYSANYTAEELRGISDFYSSPVGKALIAKQEKVATETLLVLQKRIQQATSAINNTAK